MKLAERHCDDVRQLPPSEPRPVPAGGANLNLARRLAVNDAAMYAAASIGRRGKVKPRKPARR